jgi:hypothetical protein
MNARALGLFLLLGLSLLSGRASAAGFDTARFGSEHGHATGATPFAVYYNPAALSTTKRIHIALDVTLLMHGASYERTETTVTPPADAAGANTGKTTLLDMAPLPSLAASLQLGDLALGAGLYAPVSGFQRWKGNDDFKGNTKYPGAQDGPARWHLIEGDLALINATLAGAYHIRPARLTLGAGLNANYMRLRLVRANTGALNDDITQEGRVRIDGQQITASFSAGALVEPLIGKLWLGASYQSPPGFYREMHLDGNVRSSLGGIESKNRTTVHQYWPDVLARATDRALRAASVRRLHALEPARAAVRHRRGQRLRHRRARQRKGSRSGHQQPDPQLERHFRRARRRQLLPEHGERAVRGRRLRQQRHSRRHARCHHLRWAQAELHAGRAHAPRRALRPPGLVHAHPAAGARHHRQERALPRRPGRAEPAAHRRRPLHAVVRLSHRHGRALLRLSARLT